jgi:hypothetical protein
VRARITMGGVPQLGEVVADVFERCKEAGIPLYTDNIEGRQQ